MRSGVKKFFLIVIAVLMCSQFLGCCINFAEKKYFTAGASAFAFLSVAHLFYMYLAQCKQWTHNWTVCRFKLHWALSIFLCILTLNTLVHIVVALQDGKKKFKEKLEENNENLWPICNRLIAALWWNVSVCISMCYIYKHVHKRSIFQRNRRCENVVNLIRTSQIGVDNICVKTYPVAQGQYLVQYYSN
uniref:Uncharacterized protein n=1 Tax=Globodera rostochiensis TaxID=31243 RepID=A0A914HL97_GLORO